MLVDEKTKKYFSDVKQVFLYISDKCNLLCKQCLYKPNVIKGKVIELETAKQLLYVFRQLGAFKLTVLGGEISLYDKENNYEKLISLMKYAHQIGYQYIRIDTNGQETDFFKSKQVFEFIDEVSFSIDGYDETTNDILRGSGSFANSLKSINLLRSLNKDIYINITTCVAKENTGISGGIKDFINSMIAFATKLNIKQLNFHGVFKMGVPMDTWTENTHLDPVAWYNEIKGIVQNIENKIYPIDIRFPIHIIKKKEFDAHPKYYGYCPCKLGERALIHPDGIIRVCSSMLSTPYGVAHYNSDKIMWNEFNNELMEHKMDENTPCTNQTGLYLDDFCPVCFSLKPYQNEIVWKKSNVESFRKE